MAPNKGRRRVRRVQRVKHDFLTLIDAVPLTKKGQQILKLLGAGNPASVVARAVGMTTTTTASEAPCLGLEVVALQRLKTTTSRIKLQKAWRACCCWLKPYARNNNNCCRNCASS